MKFTGKQVLITGASGGIGAAAALEIARRGGRPILVARREEALKEVAEGIRAAVYGGEGAEPLWIVADVTEPEGRRKIREVVNERVGWLDILINNAGITAHGRFDQSEPSVLRRAMELNFFAAAELTAELLPLVRAARSAESGSRQIVLVSTPSGLYGVPGRFAYSASKAAGHAWMETLRIELKSEGIHSLIFCPGYTRTELRTSGLAADGGTLAEEQAGGALEPEVVAGMLCRGMEAGKRIVFTGGTGRLVYWLRTLAPGLLERLMSKKLKKDFENSEK